MASKQSFLSVMVMTMLFGMAFGAIGPKWTHTGNEHMFDRENRCLTEGYDECISNIPSDLSFEVVTCCAGLVCKENAVQPPPRPNVRPRPPSPYPSLGGPSSTSDSGSSGDRSLLGTCTRE